MHPRRRPRDLDSSIAAVVFSVPEERLADMDVATGPCVPLPGHEGALRSPLTQHGGETPALTSALYTALTGEDSKNALVVMERAGKGLLSRCSPAFIGAMASASERTLRLADEDDEAGDVELTRFSAAMAEIDQAWMRAANWPRSVVGTQNRLVRLGEARQAREKGQSLYCWHGPAVPQFTVVSGTGPYPA